MKHRFFKRATALLLALVTMMSLVTFSFADADGHGTGGGNNAGTSAGTFSRSWAGYRIYLFDATTGQERDEQNRQKEQPTNRRMGIKRV